MRFDVFGPGNATPKVTHKLLNRAGAAMSDIRRPGSRRGVASSLDLPLAGLAAGEYLVEVAATTDDTSAWQLVAFRITS